MQDVNYNGQMSYVSNVSTVVFNWMDCYMMLIATCWQVSCLH